MGITNMAATIPGFIVPALVGALTHANVRLLLRMGYQFKHINKSDAMV